MTTPDVQTVLTRMASAIHDRKHSSNYITACAEVGVELFNEGLGVHVVQLDSIFGMIVAERARQDAKWGWPNAGLAGGDLYKKVAILSEECGEVANAVLEHDHDNLKVELVQVAAVCVAWLQAFAEAEQLAAA